MVSCGCSSGCTCSKMKRSALVVGSTGASPSENRWLHPVTLAGKKQPGSGSRRGADHGFERPAVEFDPVPHATADGFDAKSPPSDSQSPQLVPGPRAVPHRVVSEV